MGALVTVRNDGPDAVEIRFGPSSRLLHPGQQVCMATSHRVDVVPLPPINKDDLALHMGYKTNSEPKIECRYVED